MCYTPFVCVCEDHTGDVINANLEQNILDGVGFDDKEITRIKTCLASLYLLNYLISFEVSFSHVDNLSSLFHSVYYTQIFSNLILKFHVFFMARTNHINNYTFANLSSISQIEKEKKTEKKEIKNGPKLTWNIMYPESYIQKSSGVWPGLLS